MDRCPMATDEDSVPCCQRPHHPGNDYCNHCGKALQKPPKPLRLRRTSRHVYCIRCGINGERSTHAYCGVCGDRHNWGYPDTMTGPPPPTAPPALALALALPGVPIAVVNVDVDVDVDPSDLIDDEPASTTRSHKRGGTRKNKANKRAKTSITSGAIGDGHGADASGAGHGAAIGAGHDAGHDADIGAGHDAGIGAGHDAGHDAAIGAGHDVGHDAGIGAGHDAGIGAGIGAGQDGSGQERSKPGGGTSESDGDMNGDTGGEHTVQNTVKNTIKNTKKNKKSSAVSLAHGFVEEKHGATVRSGNWTSSIKYDGMRIHFDTTTQKLLTRNNKEVIIPDSWQESLRHIDLNLDGELIAIDAENPFRRTMQVCRRTTNPDFDAWEQEIRLFVFDIVDSTDRPFSERYATLKKLYQDGTHPFIRLVTQTPIDESTDLNALLNEAVAKNEEGLMLKDNSRPYEFKRSTGCLKMKRHYTLDCELIDFIPGKGKHSGALGAMLLRAPSGVEFQCGSGFDDSQRANYDTLFQIGATIEVKFWEIIKASGRPRFPIFVCQRYDK